MKIMDGNMKNFNDFHFSLLTKNYRGIFISFGKYWKGIYWHFPGFTIRIFLWGIDWYDTKAFERGLKIKGNNGE